MDELVKYLYEIGLLKRVKRSGWWIANVNNPESIAEHVFRTTIIGYFIAKKEGADLSKTMLMCLFHDTTESRINDINNIGRKYMDFLKIEEKVFRDQTNELPIEIQNELNQIFYDFLHNSTLESDIAHDADNLEFLLSAKEYKMVDNHEFSIWINNCIKKLKTQTAKSMAKCCLEHSPDIWWQQMKLFTSFE